MNSDNIRLGGRSATSDDFIRKERLHYDRLKGRRASPMTICAAAICRHGSKEAVLAISDRKITSGDIEFEDQHSKMWALSPQAVCLFAGNSVFHHMIRSATHRTILADGITDIGEMADLYASNFVAVRRRRAEQRHLAPLGLSADTFLSRQRELNPDQVSSLMARMLDETLGVQAIIAGVDAMGAHIHAVGVEGGEICQNVCYDGRDFVAIGTGYRQFESQFMSIGYTRDLGSLYGLLLMWSAKRKAEISPGVGKATDAVIISDAVREYVPAALEAVDRYYRELEESARRTREEVHARMRADALLCADPVPLPSQPPLST